MILLSFDIEEFDMPLEYNGVIPFEEQISVSRIGLQNILKILNKHNVKATFFSTVVFAEHNKDLIQQLLSEGHELASHTWFHSDFEEKHLKESKEKLAEMFGTEITGLRMPRMSPVSGNAVADAGYEYNSSINPTYLPGRYNNLGVKRTYFKEAGVWQLPASVSPIFRVPLFWLSFHNFPTFVYRFLAKRCWQNTGYLNVYFHPWEFNDISKPEYKLPGYTFKNTAEKMIQRFDEFILWAKGENQQFCTIRDFVKSIK